MQSSNEQRLEGIGGALRDDPSDGFEVDYRETS